MKLGLKFEELKKAMDVASVYDKIYPEDRKLFYLWYTKEKGFRWLGNSINATAFYTLQTMYIADDTDKESMEDFMSVINSKELQSIVSAYSGLKLTEVEDVYFDINTKDESIIFIVHEKPTEGVNLKATVQKYKLKYQKHDKYAVQTINQLKGHATEELKKYNSVDYIKYLDVLLPTIATENRETPYSRIYVEGDFIYTKPMTFTAVLNNGNLPTDLTGYMFSATITACVLKSLKDCETFEYFVETDTNLNVCNLYFKTVSMELYLKVPAIVKKQDIMRYKENAEQKATYIELNKQIVMEAIKRLQVLSSGGEDAVRMSFNFVQGVHCNCTMSTFETQLEVPVLDATADTAGEISCVLSISILKKMLLQGKELSDKMYFLIEDTGAGDYVGLCITDSIESDKRTWQTYMPKVKKKGGKQTWN